MPKHRLLFSSIHSYLDPSSGAALATRELLELLTARGWDCRALTCGVLDYAQETPLEDVLTAVERPTSRAWQQRSREAARPKSLISNSAVCGLPFCRRAIAVPTRRRASAKPPSTSIWSTRYSSDFAPT